MQATPALRRRNAPSRDPIPGPIPLPLARRGNRRAWRGQIWRPRGHMLAAVRQVLNGDAVGWTPTWLRRLPRHSHTWLTSNASKSAARTCGPQLGNAVDTLSASITETAKFSPLPHPAHAPCFQGCGLSSPAAGAQPCTKTIHFHHTKREARRESPLARRWPSRVHVTHAPTATLSQARSHARSHARAHTLAATPLVARCGHSSPPQRHNGASGASGPKPSCTMCKQPD